MFKCLNGLAPNYLSRNFKYVNHCHNTRYQDKRVLDVIKTKLEITKRALAHHGAINWNTLLPDYSKSALSLNVFKSVVLKYMYSFSWVLKTFYKAVFIAFISFKLYIKSFIITCVCLVLYIVQEFM